MMRSLFQLNDRRGKSNWIALAGVVGCVSILIVLLVLTKKTPESQPPAPPPTQVFEEVDHLLREEARHEVTAPQLDQFPTFSGDAIDDYSLTITGVVNSHVLNGPIEGARIIIRETTLHLDSRGGVRRETPEERIIEETTTDSQGYFELDLEITITPNQRNMQSIEISAAGHESVSGSVQSHPGLTRFTADVTLAEGRELPVMVRYSNGQSIEHAIIQTRRTNMPSTSRVPGIIYFMATSRATAGEDGRFLLEGVGVDANLRATANIDWFGNYTKLVGKDTDFLDFVIPIGDATIIARVENPEGHPIPRVRVSIASSNLEGEDLPQDFSMDLQLAATDGQGTTRIGKLPAGVYRVRTQGGEGLPPRMPSVSQEVTLAQGETAEVILRIAPPITISGRVIDKDTERPIPNAEISFALIGAAMRWNPFAPQRSQDGSSVYSDGNGEFTLTGYPQSGFMNNMIFVDPPEGYLLQQESSRFYGFSSVEFELEQGSTTASDVTVRLIKGQILTGKVIDEDSRNPVPNVQVSATSDPFRGSGNSHGHTDEEGHFRMTLHDDTRYHLRVQNEQGAADLTIRTEKDVTHEPVTLVLKKGGTVAGRVTNEEGDPVPMVTVVWGQQRGPFTNYPSTQTRTDQDGSYKLEGVGPGNIQINVQPPNDSVYAPPPRQNLTVESGSLKENVDFVLARGEDITGLVVDQNNEPVPQAGIQWFVSIPNRATTHGTTLSNEEGEFTIRNITPDTTITQISASKEGYIPEFRQGYNPLDGELRLVMGKQTALMLQAVDLASGRPLPHYEYLIYESAWDEYSAWNNSSIRVNNPEGKTELRNLNRGGKRVVVVEVNEQGEATGRKGSALFSADRQGGDPVRVEVHRPFEVKGQVLGRGDDDPVEGAKVFVVADYPYQTFGTLQRSSPRRHEAFNFKPVLTDRRGNFTLEGFTHGTFTIAAEMEEMSSRVTETIVIEPGVPIPTVALKMEDSGSIKGRITDCEGEPVSGVRVTMMARQMNRESTTNREGEYTFDGIPEGQFNLQYMMSNHQGIHIEQVSVGRGENVVHDVTFCDDVTLTGVVYFNGQPGNPQGGASIGFFHRDSYFRSHLSLNIQPDGRYNIQTSPGTWDVYAIIGQHSLYIPFDEFHIPEGVTEFEVDIHYTPASVDIVFEYPDDVPRSGGFISFTSEEREELPRRGGAFSISPTDERRHLPGVPEGRHKVIYESYNGLLRGESEPTDIIAGELNVIFIEIGMGDGERARIAEAQSLLNQSGFDAGPVDGLMGPMTAGAIRAFQEANNMTVTGEVSNQLLDALRQ